MIYKLSVSIISFHYSVWILLFSWGIGKYRTANGSTTFRKYAPSSRRWKRFLCHLAWNNDLQALLGSLKPTGTAFCWILLHVSLVYSMETKKRGNFANSMFQTWRHRTSFWPLWGTTWQPTTCAGCAGANITKILFAFSSVFLKLIFQQIARVTHANQYVAKWLPNHWLELFKPDEEPTIRLYAKANTFKVCTYMNQSSLVHNSFHFLVW